MLAEPAHRGVNRKHAIRGLWRRNGKFVARITVKDDAGRKAVKWVPLDASAGSSKAARMPMLAMPTSNSIRVKAGVPKTSSRAVRIRVKPSSVENEFSEDITAASHSLLLISSMR